MRPIKETSDHYTCYELRRLMQDFKFYPSVRTAMHSLAEEYAAGMEPQRPDTPGRRCGAAPVAEGEG